MTLDKIILQQKHAWVQLINELKTKRLAHAYLFIGPKGVGRTTTALTLFQILNCKKASSFNYNLLSTEATNFFCGICSNCRRISTRQHEDLLIISPPQDQLSSQIKIEEIRNLIRILKFPPFGEKWRLILIREAEQMNLSSANVLLKILEEPPIYNLLVLTTRDPAKILPTLVSRCRKVTFCPLPECFITTELIQRGIDPKIAKIRAILSAGSLSQALALNYEFLQENLELILKNIASQGSLRQDWNLIEKIISPFKTEERLNREGIANFLNIIMLYYRDQAVIAIDQTQYTLLPTIFNFRKKPLSIKTSLAAFFLVCQTQNQIINNVTPELALAILLDNLRQIRG